MKIMVSNDLKCKTMAIITIKFIKSLRYSIKYNYKTQISYRMDFPERNNLVHRRKTGGILLSFGRVKRFHVVHCINMCFPLLAATT